MEIIVTPYESCTHVAPRGRLDTLTAPLLEKELAEHADCILDLAGVEYISSMGLRAIMVAAKRSRENGLNFVLCGLRGDVKEVFEISGFDKLLEIRADLEEARRRAG